MSFGTSAKGTHSTLLDSAASGGRPRWDAPSAPRNFHIPDQETPPFGGEGRTWAITPPLRGGFLREHQEHPHPDSSGRSRAGSPRARSDPTIQVGSGAEDRPARPEPLVRFPASRVVAPSVDAPYGLYLLERSSPIACDAQPWVAATSASMIRAAASSGATCSQMRRTVQPATCSARSTLWSRATLCASFGPQ